jgi:hypothetical protein
MDCRIKSGNDEKGTLAGVGVARFFASADARWSLP